MAKDDKRPQRAYRNEAFMASPEARPLRMLAEYLEPADRFARHKIDDTIVFYGSARIASRETAEASLAEARAAGHDLAEAERRVELSRYYEAARELSRRLTEWSKGLAQSDRRFVVCTGGGPGIMEAASRGASEARGHNVGLGINLPFEEAYNPYVSREIAFSFHYFFMRKFWFTYMAKAVVVMPGGFGTLDEMFELLTLVQTGRVKKRVAIVLFGQDYWSEVIDFQALARYGTISEKDLELVLKTDSVDEAFDYITETLKAYAIDHPGAQL